MNLFGNIQKKAKDPIVTQLGYKGTFLCPKVVATKVVTYVKFTASDPDHIDADLDPELSMKL